MKVYNYEVLVADMPMHMRYINLEKIISGTGSIMLLYQDKKFQNAIKNLFDDVVRQANLSWQVPDYEKSRTYFYISGQEIMLSIEVLPKYFSAKEKQYMLQSANQEEMPDGWSEYLRLLNMFDDIDEILNDSCPVGEVGTYFLELTTNEKESLFSLIEKIIV